MKYPEDFSRFKREAVIIFFTLWPALVGFLVSFLLLLFCGLVLIFRHKTRYGLILLIIGLCAVCEFLAYFRILQSFSSLVSQRQSNNVSSIAEAKRILHTAGLKHSASANLVVTLNKSPAWR